MGCYHGIEQADEGFLIFAAKVLGDAETIQEAEAVERLGVGGPTGDEVIERSFQDFGQVDEFIDGRRVEPAFVLVELGRVDFQFRC